MVCFQSGKKKKQKTATCFEFNSCHLNPSSHCTWMNMRHRQHSHQKLSPSGFRLSCFLWTCFIRSGNPLNYEAKWWFKLLGLVWGRWPVMLRERELFSQSMKPPAKSKSPASLFVAAVANAPLISSPLCLMWRTQDHWEDGRVPAVSLPQCAWTCLKTAAIRCAIPRKSLGFCHMLQKGSMKWNINDFQRLDTRVVENIVSEVQLPLPRPGWLLWDHSQVIYPLWFPMS